MHTQTTFPAPQLTTDKAVAHIVAYLEENIKHANSHLIDCEIASPENLNMLATLQQIREKNTDELLASLVFVGPDGGLCIHINIHDYIENPLNMALALHHLNKSNQLNSENRTKLIGHKEPLQMAYLITGDLDGRPAYKEMTSSHYRKANASAPKPHGLQ